MEGVAVPEVVCTGRRKTGLPNKEGMHQLVIPTGGMSHPLQSFGALGCRGIKKKIIQPPGLPV